MKTEQENQDGGDEMSGDLWNYIVYLFFGGIAVLLLHLLVRRYDKKREKERQNDYNQFKNGT